MNRLFIAAPALAVSVSLIACFTTGAGAEQSDTTSGNYMVKRCNPERGLFMDGYCLGVIDTLVEIAATNVCAPKLATREQGVRVVVTYLEARPHRLHESFKS